MHIPTEKWRFATVDRKLLQKCQQNVGLYWMLVWTLGSPNVPVQCYGNMIDSLKLFQDGEAKTENRLIDAKHLGAGNVCLYVWFPAWKELTVNRRGSFKVRFKHDFMTLYAWLTTGLVNGFHRGSHHPTGKTPIQVISKAMPQRCGNVGLATLQCHSRYGHIHPGSNWSLQRLGLRVDETWPIDPYSWLDWLTFFEAKKELMKGLFALLHVETRRVLVLEWVI